MKKIFLILLVLGSFLFSAILKTDTTKFHGDIYVVDTLTGSGADTVYHDYQVYWNELWAVGTAASVAGTITIALMDSTKVFYYVSNDARISATALAKWHAPTKIDSALATAKDSTVALSIRVTKWIRVMEVNFAANANDTSIVKYYLFIKRK